MCPDYAHCLDSFDGAEAEVKDKLIDRNWHDISKPLMSFLDHVYLTREEKKALPSTKDFDEMQENMTHLHGPSLRTVESAGRTLDQYRTTMTEAGHVFITEDEYTTLPTAAVLDRIMADVPIPMRMWPQSLVFALPSVADFADCIRRHRIGPHDRHYASSRLHTLELKTASFSWNYFKDAFHGILLWVIHLQKAIAECVPSPDHHPTLPADVCALPVWFPSLTADGNTAWLKALALPDEVGQTKKGGQYGECMGYDLGVSTKKLKRSLKSYVDAEYQYVDWLHFFVALRGPVIEYLSARLAAKMRAATMTSDLLLVDRVKCHPNFISLLHNSGKINIYICL